VVQALRERGRGDLAEAVLRAPRNG